MNEHPFAEFIKILGKGKKGSRPLTQDEAYRAMKMIMDDEVEPIQLGAFLMLMRVKEETPEELAGFVQAARESFQASRQGLDIELDWSSYAGKRRHLPWFILATLLLAENGVRILMHGAEGHSENRVYTQDMLALLGVASAGSIEEAEQQLQQYGFSYLPLRVFCPKLYDMIQLRPLMGLRSPVHTLVRLLNPFNAEYTIQGIFHPSYRQVHQKAALLLRYPHMAVLKGEGGETERNPDVDCLVQSVHQQVLSEEIWPALFKRRHIRPDELRPEQLKQLWQGDYDDEFAEATIIGTTAVVLKFLGKADSQEQAHTMAKGLWQNRNRARFK